VVPLVPMAAQVMPHHSSTSPRSLLTYNHRGFAINLKSMLVLAVSYNNYAPHHKSFKSKDNNYQLSASNHIFYDNAV